MTYFKREQNCMPLKETFYNFYHLKFIFDRKKLQKTSFELFSKIFMDISKLREYFEIYQMFVRNDVYPCGYTYKTTTVLLLNK